MYLLLAACGTDPESDKPSTTDGILPGTDDTDDTDDTDTSGTDDTSDIDTGPTQTGDTGTITVEIPYFEPYYVNFTVYFGYDPVLNSARWYWADSSSVAPLIIGTLFQSLIVFDENYETNACGFMISDNDSTSFVAGAPWTVEQDGASVEHLGFILAPGTFSVLDYADPVTGMPSCRSLAFDPAVYGQSFADWAAAREWGFGLGDIDPVVQQTVEIDPSFAGLASLLSAGQLTGGSIQTGEDARYGGLLAVGYPMDNNGNFDALTPLLSSEMWPETHIPAQGVYTLFLPQWILADELFGP